MDSNRIPENGRYVAFKVGDLVKIDTTRIIDFVRRSYTGELGMVSGEHLKERQMILPFIPILIFSTNEVRFFSPQELKIISNIGD